jgi:hypothetical protein
VLSEAFKLFTKNISHTFVFSTVLQEQISDNDTGDCVDGRKVDPISLCSYSLVEEQQIPSYTQLGNEPRIYSIPGKNANNYITDVVL